MHSPGWASSRRRSAATSAPCRFMRATAGPGRTRASYSRSSGASTRRPRARTARSSWTRPAGPIRFDPRRASSFRRRCGGGLPIACGNRLLQVEHVPVGIDELGEPLAPLHLLGRHRELDAGAAESLVVFLNVVRDERDAGGTRFGRPAHVAEVNAGPRAARTNLDPVAGIVGGALDARVRVRLARADVRDVQTETGGGP